MDLRRVHPGAERCQPFGILLRVVIEIDIGLLAECRRRRDYGQRNGKRYRLWKLRHVCNCGDDVGGDGELTDGVMPGIIPCTAPSQASRLYQVDNGSSVMRLASITTSVDFIYRSPPMSYHATAHPATDPDYTQRLQIGKANAGMMLGVTES